MAKWTLTRYLTVLRQKIDEVGSTDLFTDEELTAYINAGINDMALELRVEEMKELSDLETVQAIDFKEVFVSESERTKPIADRTHDLLQIKSIFHNGYEMTLGYVDERHSGKDIAYVWANKVRFTVPKSGTLEFFYYRKPKTLVNLTDTTDIPEQYQHIVLEYAVAECKRKDGEEAQYNNVMQSYYEKKGEMEMEMENRFSEGNHYIAIIDGVD